MAQVADKPEITNKPAPSEVPEGSQMRVPALTSPLLTISTHIPVKLPSWE